MSIVDDLILNGELKTDKVIQAFRHVKRSDFTVSGDLKEAGENRPLPIGQKQTISQPSTVAFMLELLQVQSGDKVLDIGSGSGWTSALLAFLVGDLGRVYAVERIEALKKFGQFNLRKYPDLSRRVAFVSADGSIGLEKESPFDKILVSAGAKEIPNSLIKQLKPGGNLVIPVGSEALQSVFLLHKDLNNKLKIKEFPGFVFVPLV